MPTMRCIGSWRVRNVAARQQHAAVGERREHMAEPPLISCIVPVFNGQRYLREALDSILSQTYGPLEVIVADDGSTDRTAEFVAGYGEKVQRLWQPNAGPSAARNLGLGAAHGEFVAFLDADDLWHPEKLARQMARFEARPELDLCVAGYQNFWIPELIGEDERYLDPRLRRPTAGYVNTSTLLVRHRVFETVGQFNRELRLAEDVEWFMRAYERGLVVELLPDVLLYRRFHHANVSRTLTAQYPDVLVHLVKASLARRRGPRPPPPGAAAGTSPIRQSVRSAPAGLPEQGQEISPGGA